MKLNISDKQRKGLAKAFKQHALNATDVASCLEDGDDTKAIIFFMQFSIEGPQLSSRMTDVLDRELADKGITPRDQADRLGLGTDDEEFPF